MSFTDALIEADRDCDVVMVDRRHAAGGHWNDACPCAPPSAGRLLRSTMHPHSARAIPDSVVLFGALISEWSALSHGGDRTHR